MTLRARIALIVLLCFTVLTLGLTYSAVLRETVMTERFAESKMRAQQGLWRQVTGKLAQGLTGRVEEIVSLPGLRLAVSTQDTSALPQMLQSVSQRLRRDGISLVEVVDAAGGLLYGSSSGLSAGGAQRAVVDAGLLARLTATGPSLSTIARDHDGRLLVALVHPLVLGDQLIGALVLGQPVDQALEDIRADAGIEVYVTDPRFEVVQGTDVSLWASLSRAIIEAGPGAVVDVVAGDHVYSVVVRTLTSATGAHLGFQITIEDVSETYRHLSATRHLSNGAAVAFVLVLLLALSAYLHRVFRPLSAAISGLNALSRGDLSVEVDGGSGEDEVSRVSNAVRVLRDQQRLQQREAEFRTRRRQRQQRHIRRQMLNMAETLDAEARQQVMQDLDRIERASRQSSGGTEDGKEHGGSLDNLALAFDIMVQRVREQHSALDTLVNELREALNAKNELASLQQQLEITGHMQKSMLPRAFPPREDVEVTGQLLQATEFGGTFYDYFLIDQGHIAIVAAEVEGHGLPAAFFTLTARSLTKALALLGLPPADCLARVNDMLVADSEEETLSARMILAVVDSATGTLSYATAGGFQPLLLRRVGEVTAVPIDDEPPLGLHRGTTYSARQLTLPTRATLVACSSGVAETATRDGSQFTQAALLATLRRVEDLSPAVVVEGVMEAVTAFAADHPRAKDANALALRFLGPQ